MLRGQAADQPPNQRGELRHGRDEDTERDHRQRQQRDRGSPAARTDAQLEAEQHLDPQEKPVTIAYLIANSGL